MGIGSHPFWLGVIKKINFKARYEVQSTKEIPKDYKLSLRSHESGSRSSWSVRSTLIPLEELDSVSRGSTPLANTVIR